MSADQAREIAERVARRVGGAAVTPRERDFTDLGSELAAVRATLNELQNRLIQIESKVTSAPRVQSPWLAGANGSHLGNASHPSLERFGVEEATVSELVDYFQ